jgi:hypothetical protein
VIVATELSVAARLLGDDRLHCEGGHVVCLDLGLDARRGDPFVVSDLDEGAWAERFTASDRALAPAGLELVQAQLGLRPGETADAAGERLERLLDASFPDWRARTRWRRRQVMAKRTGALDLPGSTWRDRPAIDQGDGVLLAGDMVAAEGLLCETSFASAQIAAATAAEAARTRAATGAVR